MTGRIQVALWAAAASSVLTACGSAGQPTDAPDVSEPIVVQDGTSYIFEPAAIPAEDSVDILTAQEAYDALQHQDNQKPGPIPANTNAAFGYLTEDDTLPPADHMPVWAFTVRAGCVNTFRASKAQCIVWRFARASDGKDLGVVDQQSVP